MSNVYSMVGVKYARTLRYAALDMGSRWDLIEAIADDANDNDFAVSGIASQLATREALEKVGNELSAVTVQNLTVTAKFYDESTIDQRDLWRTYGWTIVRALAKAGWSHAAAAELLSTGRRPTRSQVDRAIADARVPGDPKPDLPLHEAWLEWLKRINRDLLDGAKLAERSETEDVQLDTYSALAQLTYQRITERKLDAELRDLLEGSCDA